MNEVIIRNTTLEKDILISRALITKAHQRKEELDALVTKTATNVALLRHDTTILEKISIQ